LRASLSRLDRDDCLFTAPTLKLQERKKSALFFLFLVTKNGKI